MANIEAVPGDPVQPGEGARRAAEANLAV